MGIAISIEDLSFTYPFNQRPALHHIQTQIEDGTFVVVMGHSGAGKSTLCYCLNGLIPQFFRGIYQGCVWVKGKEVALHKVSDWSRLVGLVFQDFEAQLFSTNVELEMAFGPENHCLTRSEIEKRINRYLSFVGLEGHRHREPSSLSGGQKQRLAIGSVLALEPEILVMDEPTTDLDPQGRDEILSIANRLREEGRTLLMVDHDPETAIDADLVILLREGKVVAQGSPENVLRDQSLLQSSGVKLLPMLELFHSMGWPGNPLKVNDSMEIIKRLGLAQRKESEWTKQPLPEVKGKPILWTEGLHYTYPIYGLEALRGIDLSIYEGEFVALLGQNGSGKTTLAKQFNGLLKPTSGQVWVQGKPTKEYTQREMAQRVGYVFQNPDHQIFARTVKEEVGFGLKVLGEHPKAIEKRVAEVLEIVGLEGYETKVPFTLTKGERQRVAVASVLAAQPQIIILDEPTTGLDIHHQKAIMEVLKQLNQKGHTIIIITHSMWVATEYARRTIVMKEGRILSDGPTRLVFADEEGLSRASIQAPSLVKLSNWLGTKALTIEEMVKELKGLG
jgi:energy-coupling factor transport system ATP-binding protein